MVPSRKLTNPVLYQVMTKQWRRIKSWYFQENRKLSNCIVKSRLCWMIVKRIDLNYFTEHINKSFNKCELKISTIFWDIQSSGISRRASLYGPRCRKEFSYRFIALDKLKYIIYQNWDKTMSKLMIRLPYQILRFHFVEVLLIDFLGLLIRNYFTIEIR